MNTMENTQQKIDRIAEELREIYKTNEGPRLIAEMTAALPHPRKLWNEPKGDGKPGGWRAFATDAIK